MNRHHLLTAPLLVVTFFIFVSSPSYAKLYINEVSSSTSDDWIEFYNDGESEVDLSIYKVTDTKGNTKDLGGIIGASGYATLDWYNRIDKAGDTIKLVLKSSDLVEDEISFGSASPANPAPAIDQTLGRKPDGAGAFSILSPATKGASNNSSQVTIPPTPTPTEAPTPTRTATPTKTPTPTKAPTPTKTPTPVKASPTTKTLQATQAPIKSHPTTSVLGATTKKISPSKKKERPLPTAILGVKDEKKEKKKDVLVKNATTEKKDTPLFLYFMIGGGLLCIGVCGILFYQNRKNIS
jgi:hypothetical protein